MTDPSPLRQALERLSDAPRILRILAQAIDDSGPDGLRQIVVTRADSADLRTVADELSALLAGERRAPPAELCAAINPTSGVKCARWSGHVGHHVSLHVDGSVRRIWSSPAEPASPSAPPVAGAQEPTYRSEKLLRDTVSMLCDVIWNGGRTKPGQHLWSIPVDKARDFDCILSDAIDELVALRAASRPAAPAPPQRQE